MTDQTDLAAREAWAQLQRWLMPLADAETAVEPSNPHPGAQVTAQQVLARMAELDATRKLGHH